MISEIYLVNTSRMENERASTVCPLDAGNPLFQSDDGFEPTGVIFPQACVLFFVYGWSLTIFNTDTTPTHTNQFLY